MSGCVADVGQGAADEERLKILSHLSHCRCPVRCNRCRIAEEDKSVFGGLIKMRRKVSSGNQNFTVELLPWTMTPTIAGRRVSVYGEMKITRLLNSIPH